MDGKTKLAFIGRAVSLGNALPVLECLAEKYDLTIHVLQDDAVFLNYPHNIDVAVYAPIADMPGYLQGLEDNLSECDLIVVQGISQLGSFQAVRAALKLSKPVVGILDESQPLLYQNHMNIRAIRSDIVSHVSHWIATNSHARQILEFEGVDPAKISDIPYGIDVERYQFSGEGRQKFRRAAGLRDDDTVVLFYGDLEAWNRPAELLLSLRYMLHKKEFSKLSVKLLMVGNGAQSHDLKLRAIDMGIAQNLAFLHENISLLEKDIFSASDFIVQLRPAAVHHELQVSMSVMKAMACGVVPIVAEGTVAAEWVDAPVFRPGDDSYRSIGDLILQLHGQKHDHEKYRRDIIQSVQKSYASELIAKYWLETVETQLNQFSSHLWSDRQNWAWVKDQIGRLREQGQHNDALILVEDYLCRLQDQGRKRGELLTLKGEILTDANYLDAATDALSQAIDADPTNVRTYLTLGRISIHSHSLEEALAFFKRALSYDVNSVDAHIGLGMVYLKGKLFEQAIVWFQEAVKRDRHHPKALVSLAQSCLQCPQVKAAIAALEATVELLGDEEAILLMALGQLYLRDGRTEEGQGMLSKALALGQKGSLLTAG